MKKSRVRRSKKENTLPIPAFLPGMRGSADWHVRAVKEGETPHTINHAGTHGEMALPEPDSTRNKFIRIHEMLHAAHSPVESPRPIMRPDTTFIREDAIVIAEEHRINLYGRYLVGGAKNIGTEADEFLPQTMELINKYMLTHDPRYIVDLIKWNLVTWPLTNQMISPRSPVEMIIMTERDKAIPLMSVDERADWTMLQDTIHHINWTIFHTVWTRELQLLWAKGDLPTWKQVLKLADYLSNLFDALEFPDKGLSGEGDSNEIDIDKEADPDLAKVRDIHFGTGDQDKGKPYTAAERAAKIAKDSDIDKGAEEGVKPVWGKMKIRVAEMIYRLPKNKLQRSKYRATDEGSLPRYPHRGIVDGKVFSRKKKTNGGSVLIDDSGSMHWGTKDLAAIVQSAPAVDIAAYSGYGPKNELVLVAQKGKYADMTKDDNRPVGGGNYIDLPALEWLAAQDAPRIWVSDTHVIPIAGDRRRAIRECIEICRDYDINIVFTADEARAIFEGEQEIYR